MAEYISREAGVEKITFLCELREIVCNPDDEFLRGLKNALNAVKSNEVIPSADVQPIRHERWIHVKNYRDCEGDIYSQYKCSCCDFIIGQVYDKDDLTNFCGGCGADMRGEDNG